MSGTATRTLTLSELVQGNYSFRLTVTDNHGHSASDEVAVRVTDRSLPVAEAGKDQTLSYPENSVVLDGSGSHDTLAAITGYAWKRISGPGQATLTGDTTAQATVSDLAVGTHVFRLTVTDDTGEKASGNVTVTVLPPSVPVIYEPFMCPAGAALHGQGGVGDTGFSSKWSADKGAVITSAGMSYGNLAVAGKALSLRTVGTKGTVRTIDASALASRGLLADGVRLRLPPA